MISSRARGSYFTSLIVTRISPGRIEPELPARDRFDGCRIVPEPPGLVAERGVVALEAIEIAGGPQGGAPRQDRVGQPALAEQAVDEKNTGRKQHHVRPDPPRLTPRRHRPGLGRGRGRLGVSGHVDGAKYQNSIASTSVF